MSVLVFRILHFAAANRNKMIFHSRSHRPVTRQSFSNSHWLLKDQSFLIALNGIVTMQRGHTHIPSGEERHVAALHVTAPHTVHTPLSDWWRSLVTCPSPRVSPSSSSTHTVSTVSPTVYYFLLFDSPNFAFSRQATGISELGSHDYAAGLA